MSVTKSLLDETNTRKCGQKQMKLGIICQWYKCIFIPKIQTYKFLGLVWDHFIFFIFYFVFFFNYCFNIKKIYVLIFLRNKKYDVWWWPKTTIIGGGGGLEQWWMVVELFMKNKKNRIYLFSCFLKKIKLFKIRKNKNKKMSKQTQFLFFLFYFYF